MRTEDNTPELEFDHLAVERNSFADAYFIAHSTISPIAFAYCKGRNLYIFSSFISVCIAALSYILFRHCYADNCHLFFILLALFFMIVWPSIIKGRGAKIFVPTR